MYEHGIDVKKGWFDMAALDFAAKLAAAVTFDVPGGRVVHVNDDGEFEMGIGQTDMAIFLIQGSADYDVSNPGQTLAGNFMHRAIAPTGVMSGVVATGGYELETTEFDADSTVDYDPNTLLTATASNTDEDTGGVITSEGTGAGSRVKQFVDPVCGVVSTGVHTNHNNISTLALWPVYLPGAFA
jgi:hypothetical protein